jgi:hypothetical protein
MQPYRRPTQTQGAAIQIGMSDLGSSDTGLFQSPYKMTGKRDESSINSIVNKDLRSS